MVPPRSPSAEMTALRDRARRHVPGQALPSPLGEDDVRHLVRRLTWGASPALLGDIAAQGPQAWLDGQLEPASVDDRDCDGLVGRFGRIGRSIAQVSAENNGNWDTMWELGMATVARYTWSRRQLFEVMCDFWSNHLHVTNPSSDVWDVRHDYDRSVVRTHALGSFTSMLVASARHPAMLRYLDGASSTRQAPNENHGREILELHTVGRGAGYGEAGVKAVARVLTGSTVGRGSAYRFEASRHDPGAASVLGWSTPAHDATQGEAVQESLLRHLAAHRSTAEHLATKLVRRFVSDEPVPGLASRLADVYQRSGTQVVPVLRALFASPEFWASKGAKTRRPLEGYIAAIRTTGAFPTGDGLGGMDSLYWQSRDFGHAPLLWGPPNGFPDVAAAWQSAGSTLGRWNATTTMVNGWYPTLQRPPSTDMLPNPLPPNYGELVHALSRRVLGRSATDREMSAMLGFCEKQYGSPLNASDMWVGPRLSYVVQTLLNSPGHMER